MSSGAEPEDLDLGCSGKTNAGSPEKKYFVVTIFQIYIEKIFKYESGVSSILIFLFTFQFLQKATGV